MKALWRASLVALLSLLWGLGALGPGTLSGGLGGIAPAWTQESPDEDDEDEEEKPEEEAPPAEGAEEGAEETPAEDESTLDPERGEAEETPPEEAPEEAEPYEPPAVSFGEAFPEYDTQESDPSAIVELEDDGPIRPSEEPVGPPIGPDPEIFLDPSTLPGPLPPPPTVLPSYHTDSKFTDITADYIVQDRVEKTIALTGNVVVVYEDTVVRSQEGFIDEGEEQAHFWGEGGVEAQNDEGILNCADLKLDYAEDEKHALATGAVDLFVYKKETTAPLPTGATRRDKLKRALEERDTTIKGDVLHYWWGSKDFHVYREDGTQAEILQEGRTAKARDIDYTKEPEVLTMEGGVELWQEDGLWLYAHDLIKNKDSKVLKALLSVASTVTCDSLVREEDKRLLVLDGDVYWKQEDKEGKAEKLTIDESGSPEPPLPEVLPRHYRVSLAGLEDLGIATEAAYVTITDAKKSEDPEEMVPENATGGQILIAEGDVYGQQFNGDWLFEYDIVEADANEKVKADARKPGEGWADVVYYHLDTEDMEALGNVRGEQQHQWAVADKVEYRKANDRVYLNGNVRMKRRDKHELLSESGIMYLVSDVYEALGFVESQVTLQKEKLEASDTDGGRVLTEFPKGSHWTVEPEGGAAVEGEGDAAPAGEGAAGEESAGGEERPAKVEGGETAPESRTELLERLRAQALGERAEPTKDEGADEEAEDTAGKAGEDEETADDDSSGGEESTEGEGEAEEDEDEEDDEESE